MPRPDMVLLIRRLASLSGSQLMMVALLTTAEVAKLLRISARTVRLWAECSELPALRVGSQWRFRVTEIERLLTKGGQQAEPRPGLRIPTKASTESGGNANGIPGRRRTVLGA
jgi:excisionase family DNA binding protein